MKKYTKKQRHEIYRNGLENFDRFNTSGLCHVVIKASGLLMTSSEIKPYFPELFLFQPLDNPNCWWDMSSESNEERKLVLMFCIAMTE